MDNFIELLFSRYDLLIQNLPSEFQIILSLLLLLFLIWNIYVFIKSGNWLFLAILIAALPGTWPASKKILIFFWLLCKGLFYRLLS